jgi:hypothetical protein
MAPRFNANGRGHFGSRCLYSGNKSALAHFIYARKPI